MNQEKALQDLFKKMPRALRYSAPFIVDWRRTARAKQRLPLESKFHTMLIQSGRGWGKTKTGLQWVAENLLFADPQHPAEIGIICRTKGDAKRLLRRPDGLLRMMPPEKKYWKWNDTELHGKLWNGSTLECFSSEEPQATRGPQFTHLLFDEASSFRYKETIDNALFGLRKGAAQLLITTTLKRNDVTRMLIARASGEGGIIVKGATKENLANLNKEAFARWEAQLGDSLIGKQELYGEFIDEIPGALFTMQNIEKNRINNVNTAGHTFAIGVDPQGSHRRLNLGVDKDDMRDLDETSSASETGLCVMSTNGRELYIHEDATLSGPPYVWGAKIRELTYKYGGPEATIGIVEVNFGGEMAIEVLRQCCPELPVRAVRAHESKYVRAEPVAEAYSRDIIKHVGIHAKLEDEMTSFTPNTKKSPNRMDAMVWAATALMHRRESVVIV